MSKTPTKKSKSQAQKELAKSAKKKNVRDVETNFFTFETRGSQVLKPEDQRLKKFTLQNLKNVQNQGELRFMIQEVNNLLSEKMKALNMSPEEKSEEVARMLKFYQKDGIFANCDHIIFYSQGNTVSFFGCIIINNF